MMQSATDMDYYAYNFLRNSIRSDKHESSEWCLIGLCKDISERDTTIFKATYFNVLTNERTTLTEYSSARADRLFMYGCLEYLERKGEF